MSASSIESPFPRAFQMDCSLLPVSSRDKVGKSLESIRPWFQHNLSGEYVHTALQWLFLSVTQHLYLGIPTDSPKAISISGHVHHDGLGDFYHMLEVAELVADRFPDASIAVIPEFGNWSGSARGSSKITEGIQTPSRYREFPEKYKLLLLDYCETQEYNAHGASPIRAEGKAKIDEALLFLNQSTVIIDTPFAKAPYRISSLLSSEWFAKMGIEDSKRPKGDRILQYSEFSNSTGFSPCYERLALGISAFSLGFLFPKMPVRQEFRDLPLEIGQYPLYFAYFKGFPSYTALSLYLLTIVSKNDAPVPILDVISNQTALSESPKFLEMMKALGIGKISIFDSAYALKETHLLSEEGIEIRIFNLFPLQNDLFRKWQAFADPLSGCTGDLSIAQIIAINGIPFYEAPPHKSNTMKHLSCIATEGAELKRWGENISHYLERQYSLSSADGFSIGGSDSAQRLEEWRIKRFESAVALGFSLRDPSFSKDWQSFCEFLRSRYNFNPILQQQIHRKLVLNQHPEIAQQEARIQHELCAKRSISLGEAHQQMHWILGGKECQ